MNLTGSSSLGAVGGVAGVAAPASGVGVQLCPSAPGGGAVASCAATAVPAGVSGPPSASAAVPGSSGRQQRQETSCSSRRCRRSSSDGTGRASKKRPGVGLLPLVLLLASGRGPIGHPWSRLRMSEPRPLLPELDVCLVCLVILAPLRRVAALLVLDLRVGRHGRPQERSGIAQVAVVDHPRLRVWRVATVPVLFDTVDFDRDDSFRSVLGLIRSFHNMEEPAGIPSARCKTSLASIYGLMSETSPAFHLPTSLLMRSLLDDTNLALSKVLEDQTVHGFLPVPGRRH